MEDTVFLTEDEHTVFLDSYKVLVRLSNEIISWDERNRIKAMIQNAMENGVYLRDKNGLSLLLRNVQTAMILSKEVGLERSMLIAVLLYHLVEKEVLSAQNIQSEFGEDVVSIIRRLLKANSLYSRHAAIDSENFRKLLLTFAEDVRVIIIMIADRLCLMRMINHHPDEKFRTDVAFEASYLYAPLAHRLGLYKIKSELEDLSLKYTNRETFTQIARKLKETKRSRDQYINAFIEPVKRKIEETGWEFDIKGRTKSIYSIWNKMKKQQTDIENIYDLFAIRVILDVPLEQEKAACWQVYSINTDMYQTNPKRMK